MLKLKEKCYWIVVLRVYSSIMCWYKTMVLPCANFSTLFFSFFSFWFFLFRFIVLEGKFSSYTLLLQGSRRGTSSRQALIKSDQSYKSHKSPLSLPLYGGSLRGQVIPTCFKHAPQYYPEIGDMSDRWQRDNLQQDPRYQRGDIDGRRWGNCVPTGCCHWRYSRYRWDEREEGGAVMESMEGCWVVNVETWAGNLEGKGEEEGSCEQ
jgi:hypothetical protein